MNEYFHGRDEIEKVACIVVSTNGNLPSAGRDAVSYGLLLSEKGYSINYYLDVSNKELRMIKHKMGDIPTYNRRLKKLPLKIKELSEKKEEVDLLVTISSHGWRRNGRDYINFRGKIVYDVDIQKWFKPLLKSSVRCLVLADTCHSGTMCEFTPSKLPIPKHINVVCISACDDDEYDRDDISDLYGFGGGLTTSFIDFVSLKSGSYDVCLLYKYVKNRMLKGSSTSVISYLLS